MTNSTILKLAATAVSALVFMAAWLAAPAALTPGGSSLTSAKFRGDAGTNYSRYCTRCHGGDGKSQTAKGRQTNAPDLTKSRIGNAAGSKIIANGKELMPGFKDNMSAQEIAELMGYIRGFRQ